ncbi:hypothetical protein ABKY54_004546 [Vibrio harveyi]
MFDDSGALVRRNYSLSELDPGSAFGESLQQSLNETFTGSWWNDKELISANMGDDDVKYGPFEPFEPDKLRLLFGTKKKLKKEDAEQQIKTANLPLTVPDEGYTQEALNIVMDRKKNEIMRKTQIEDSTGFINGTVQLGATVAGQILDPVNLAMNFIPGVAPAKYAAMIESAGIAGRLGIRAGVGAVEGVAGAAVVEPMVHQAQQRQQADYTMTDSLWNIAFGGVLGGGLHAGGGFVGDLISKKKVSVSPRGAIPEMMENATPETREQMLKTAVQMEAQGFHADVTAVASMDPAINPALFVQRNPRLYFEEVKKQRKSLGILSRMKRPEYQKTVAAIKEEADLFDTSKGVNVDKDSIHDAIAKLGGINRDAAVADGMDPAAFTKNRAFRAKGGKGFDEMAEALNQYGFTSLDGSPLTANSLVDIMVNGVDPKTVLSKSARQGSESEMLRELISAGYKAEEVSKALDKLAKGERLGARQKEIAESALSIIGGRRFDERGAMALSQRGAKKTTKTPEQAEQEIMDYLSGRSISDNQIDEIERLMDFMEDGLMNGDEFVDSVKSMFVDIPDISNPGEALKNSVETSFTYKNVRGADEKASISAEKELATAERDAEQELEAVQALFDEYEKMAGLEKTDLADYDEAITNAELDAQALGAALTCRLTK